MIESQILTAACVCFSLSVSQALSRAPSSSTLSPAYPVSPLPRNHPQSLTFQCAVVTPRTWIRLHVIILAVCLCLHDLHHDSAKPRKCL
eukprot:2257501-Rhodomonas_salina.2